MAEKKPRPRTYGKQPVAPKPDSLVLSSAADVGDVLPALHTLKKAELMQIARNHDLSVKGKKSDIIDRLVVAGVEE